MKNEQWMATRLTVEAVGEILKELPLSEFLDDLGMTIATGAFVDPTAYRAAITDMRKLEAFARKLQQAQEAL